MSLSENKKFWTEFIELYREQRSLWDVKSKEYSNKHLRKESLDLLVAKARETFLEADEKFVKSKIESLRASFRRELKKVSASKSTGKGADDLYQPTLWYYDLLLFTSDNEKARKGASSLQRREFLQSPTNEQEDDDNTELVENDTEESPSILEGVINISTIDRTITTPGPYNQEMATSDSSSTSHKRNKKRKTLSDIEKKKETFLDAATSMLTQQTEFKAFGNNVGFQLEDMERHQRVIAEKLISDVIYFGKLGRLNEFSVVQANSTQATQANVPPNSNGAPLYPNQHPNYSQIRPYIDQTTNRPPFLTINRPQNPITSTLFNNTGNTDVDENDTDQYLIYKDGTKKYVSL